MTAASVGIAKSELVSDNHRHGGWKKLILTHSSSIRSFTMQDLGVFDTGVHLAYTLVDFGARRTEITRSSSATCCRKPVVQQ